MASILDGDGKDVVLAKNENGTNLTARDLCNQLVETGKKSASDFLLKAERNELFVRGEQRQDIERVGRMMADIPWNDTVPLVTHNLLRNLVLTWCSRLLEERPSATAYPTSADMKDIEAAKAAQQLIEYFEFENNVDAKMWDIAKNACSHGVGGIKCYYDPEMDEVRWDLVTIFDYYIDNVENPDDAKWCVFRRYIDLHDAKELLKKVGVTQVEATSYTVNDLEEREGVEVHELWYQPDSRIEKGAYVLFVDGNVVEHMDYPYVFQHLEDPDSGQTRSYLPVCLFKVGYIRGTCYGDTWMNDAVPIQRQINEIESVMTKLRRDTGSVKLLAPGSVVDAWDDSNSMIKCDDPAKAAMVKWLEPPKYSSLLFEDRDRLEQRLYDIAGLNEVLTGAEGAKSGTSAKQIAYISQLDNMKHAGTFRHIEKFLTQLWGLTLHLVRKYYVLPRIIRIVGPADEIASVYFTGADIDGVDIRLEPRAGLERYSATKSQNVIDRHAQGLEAADNVPERSTTGLDLTMEEANLKATVIEQAKLVMEGYQVTPLTNINPVYGAQVLTGFLEGYGQELDETQIQAVINLKAMYDQLGATQAQQQQQMQQMQQQQPPQGEQVQ